MLPLEQTSIGGYGWFMALVVLAGVAGGIVAP